MSILQSVWVALDMLRLHKLRAFLTMFGVIIGVMAVTMTIMISNGFQTYITDQFKKVGAKTITIMFDPGFRSRGQNLGNVDGLRTTDVQFLRERVTSLEIISPMVAIPASRAVFAEKDIDKVRGFGTDLNGLQLQAIEVETGRIFSEGDEEGRANVCIIGKDIKDRLFANEPAEGKLLTIGGITLEVVGVTKAQTTFGESNGKTFYVPLSTAQSKWVGGSKVDYIQATPRADVKTDQAMDDIWRALLTRSGGRAVYRVDSSESILGIFNNLIAGAGTILGAVAALSLLVGGIGIMNIMLVSVTERTKEIGLRKALGARRAAILTQFMVEAATLSMVGGLIGMGIAYGIGSIVTLISAAKEWPNKGGLATPFPLTAAMGSMLFSAVIGMIFGFYPAMSASRLDPIVALRRE